MRRTGFVVVLAALVLGCGHRASGPGPGPAPAEPPPTEPAPPADPVTPAPTDGDVDLARLGGPCEAGDACPAGTTCVTYFGIAGPSGPGFSSCERTCATGEACPPGASCVTIADGPGAVCRAVPSVAD